MCRYFYIEYVNFMLKGKTLLDYDTAFVLNKCKKKGKIILRCFRQLKKVKIKRSVVLSVENRKIKNPKISYLFYKIVISIICSKCICKRKRIFKKEESVNILKVIGLIKIYIWFKIMEKESANLDFK